MTEMKLYLFILWPWFIKGKGRTPCFQNVLHFLEGESISIRDNSILKIWPKSLGNVIYIFDPFIIGMSLWLGCYSNAKIYAIVLGIGIYF